MEDSFLRRIQTYYALCVVGFLLQSGFCLILFSNVAELLTRLFQEMSLKLPLPTQLLLFMFKVRLPCISVALFLACVYVAVAYSYRPQKSQGEVSLVSTYFVTAVQIVPTFFLLFMMCACGQPLMQLIGTLG